MNNSPRHHSLTRQQSSATPHQGPYSSVVTRRPPIAPKYKPAVPERKSSLDRSNFSDRCANTPGSLSCLANNNFIPGPSSSSSVNHGNNSQYCLEDKTPTNDNNVLLLEHHQVLKGELKCFPPSFP